MLKRNVSIFVVLLMLSLAIVNPFLDNSVSANPNVLSKNDLQTIEKVFDEVKEDNIQNEFVDEIKNEDGSIFATVITKTDRIIKKDEENGVVHVTLEINRETKFADGTVDTEDTIDEISYSKNGEFYINGDKLSVDTLKQEYQSTTDNSPTAVVSTGGRDWLTYYEIHNNPTQYFYKAYKSPRNNFLDPPTNSAMFHFYTYTQDTNFQSLARQVGNARDNIAQATAALMVALGTTALTWFTVVSLIGAGGTAAVSALVIYSNSSSAKGYMLEAYNLYN